MHDYNVAVLIYLKENRFTYFTQAILRLSFKGI